MSPRRRQQPAARGREGVGLVARQAALGVGTARRRNPRVVRAMAIPNHTTVGWIASSQLHLATRIRMATSAAP